MVKMERELDVEYSLLKNPVGKLQDDKYQATKVFLQPSLVLVISCTNGR